MPEMPSAFLRYEYGRVVLSGGSHFRSSVGPFRGAPAVSTSQSGEASCDRATVAAYASYVQQSQSLAFFAMQPTMQDRVASRDREVLRWTTIGARLGLVAHIAAVYAGPWRHHGMASSAHLDRLIEYHHGITNYIHTTYDAGTGDSRLGLHFTKQAVFTTWLIRYNGA